VSNFARTPDNWPDAPSGTPIIHVSCESSPGGSRCSQAYVYAARDADVATDRWSMQDLVLDHLNAETEWRAVIDAQGTLRAWCPGTDPLDRDLLTAELRDTADRADRMLRTMRDPWPHDMLAARASALAGLATLAATEPRTTKGPLLSLDFDVAAEAADIAALTRSGPSERRRRRRIR
jgi:hypothetical protein